MAPSLIIITVILWVCTLLAVSAEYTRPLPRQTLSILDEDSDPSAPQQVFPMIAGVLISYM